MLTTKATFTTRRSGWLRGLCLAPVLILAGVLSGCLTTPGDVSSITSGSRWGYLVLKTTVSF